MAVTPHFEVVAEEKVAAVVHGRYDHPLMCCCIDGFLEAEAWGNLWGGVGVATEFVLSPAVSHSAIVVPPLGQGKTMLLGIGQIFVAGYRHDSTCYSHSLQS